MQEAKSNSMPVHVFSIPDRCKHVCLDACLCPVVCCRWSSSWRLRRATHSLPPWRHQCTVCVLPGPTGGPPVCPRVQDDPEGKSQPFLVWLFLCFGVVTSCVLCARASRVLSDVLTTGCISCAPENTYTPARLGALSKFSVVTILCRSYHFHQYFFLLRVLGALSNSSSCSRCSLTFSCLLSAVSQSVLFTLM